MRGCLLFSSSHDCCGFGEGCAHLIISKHVIPRVFLQYALLHRHLVLTAYIPNPAPAAVRHLKLGWDVLAEGPWQAKQVRIRRG